MKPFTLFIILLCLRVDSFGQTPLFDAEEWKVSSEYRYKIVNDTSFHKLILGKSKKEILKLLSTPSFYNKKDLVYCLDASLMSPTEKESNQNCQSSFLVVIMGNRKQSIDTIVIHKCD